MRTDQQSQAIRNQQQFNQLVDSGETAAEKRATAEKKLNQLIEKNRQDAKDGIATLWTEKDIAAARAGIEKQWKDPKTPKGKSYTTPAGERAEEKSQAELLTLQAQLKTLEQHASVNDVISKQRQDLWQAEINSPYCRRLLGDASSRLRKNPCWPTRMKRSSTNGNWPIWVIRSPVSRSLTNLPTRPQSLNSSKQRQGRGYRRSPEVYPHVRPGDKHASASQ